MMVDSQASSKKLRIAISGGGLAGAAVANALHNQPHIEIRVYESAPKFSEQGAAIALAEYAQKALDAILPAKALLDRAGGVKINSSRILLGSGPKAGTLIFDLGTAGSGRVVHRAALLRELLAPLPRDVLLASKKLIAIEEAEDELTLHFEDGSSHTVDALIGADGIFSRVRAHILGDSPSAKAVASGWWGCRRLVPLEEAQKKLGAELLEVPRQYGWIGDRGFMMHDVLDAGKTVQCVAAGVEQEKPEKQGSADRKSRLTREGLEACFKEWLDGPIARPMIDLLLDQDDPVAYSEWEHTDAPTYVKGRVCVIGDAAHAMTSWQASGASQALEDAAVLSSLFSKVQTPEDIGAAFGAYDAVRRPRTQRIVQSSSATGRVMTGLDAEIDTDPDKMKEGLMKRWEYIDNIDIVEHQEEAVRILRESLKREQ